MEPRVEDAGNKAAEAGDKAAEVPPTIPDTPDASAAHESEMWDDFDDVASTFAPSEADSSWSFNSEGQGGQCIVCDE